MRATYFQGAFQWYGFFTVCFLKNDKRRKRAVQRPMLDIAALAL
jgi:hypothetical protein